MSEFFFKTHCYFDSYYSIIIEDDGRVAYAYLMEGEDIIGDVWLYNQTDTPKETNWDEQVMPFLNPSEYLKENSSIAPIKDKSEIKCEWSESLNDGLIEVSIILRERFIAQIISGSKPGWSALAIKDGPLAQVY